MSSIPFPTRNAVLSTYRQIIRSSNLKLRGKKARDDTLDSPFVDQVRVEFRHGREMTDATSAWKAHFFGADIAAMLSHSISHAEALFEAGWCLNKPNEEAIRSVASFVGFDMPITYDHDGHTRLDNVLGATKQEREIEDIDIFGDNPTPAAKNNK